MKKSYAEQLEEARALRIDVLEQLLIQCRTRRAKGLLALQHAAEQLGGTIKNLENRSRQEDNGPEIVFIFEEDPDEDERLRKFCGYEGQ